MISTQSSARCAPSSCCHVGSVLLPFPNPFWHEKTSGFCAQVSEGLDVLAAINEAICDDSGRPLQNIRIRHTYILDDPYPDPPELAEHIPEGSPEPVFATVRPNHSHLLAPSALVLFVNVRFVY
jgi:hypothetical protein